ncbi:hypothetical protein BC834DRAFT_886712 [Gloeopeniophorella convolvens]|nr:hypothetical protein BC834DRAFT_886712 [Gloeopeniophorella convolvens]
MHDGDACAWGCVSFPEFRAVSWLAQIFFLAQAAPRWRDSVRLASPQCRRAPQVHTVRLELEREVARGSRSASASPPLTVRSSGGARRARLTILAELTNARCGDATDTVSIKRQGCRNARGRAGLHTYRTGVRVLCAGINTFVYDYGFRRDVMPAS